MTAESLTPQDVSTLIDHLLKSKDPATVGLRRILKRKTEKRENFPLQKAEFEDFGAPGGGMFDAQETRVLELEKQLSDLRQELAREREKTKKAAQAAYRKGMDEGQVKGTEEGKAEAGKEYEERLAELQQRIAGMLEETLTAKKRLATESQSVLVKLSMMIARKVVNTELSMNEDTVLSVIRKALGFIADRDGLVVRVAPDDLENVTGKKDFWTSISERLEGIRIEPDARIEKGGCIIESASGVADARVSVLFDELQDVLDTTWESLVLKEKGEGDGVME
ncbi:MAG: hypothetical protein GF418_15420 [Chitinivibrionales bacterium]|nr:hypothetical protein [Chitinivibrionales bacterium]MBD3397011.1 hypothetical protein [Chitinivibrionales bacterium]